MSKPSDLLFTGAWMKDADDQLRATFDLGFAAGLEAAAKVCEERAQAAFVARSRCTNADRYRTLAAANDEAIDCAAAIHALPAAQRGDDKDTAPTPGADNKETE